MDAIIAAVMHWLASAEKNVNYIESRDTIFEVPWIRRKLDVPEFLSQLCQNKHRAGYKKNKRTVDVSIRMENDNANTCRENVASARGTRFPRPTCVKSGMPW